MTGKLLLYAGIVLSLTVAAAEILSLGASARSAEPAPAASTAPAAALPGRPIPMPWVEVNRPLQLFGLAGSKFSKLPLTYRARRRGEGVERQDFLDFGSFGGSDPYLSLAIERRGNEAISPADFFVNIARIAAATGLSVARSDVPTPLPTRFGVFGTADIMVARGGHSQSCVGFRLQPATEQPAPLAVAGLACGTEAAALDRNILGCVLDRMDLISAGDDTALQDFFAAAELRRGQECLSSRLLAAGSRDIWLDSAAPAPPLKHLSSDGNRHR